nr:retrovirus-related Pol polyprotein from transposon TNT 1-94 [Tanacetum cinerariifolium]
CGDPNHLIGDCPKPLKDKNQRAFVGGSWSDSSEEDDEKAKDETCLICLGVDLEPDEWIKDNGCSKHVTGNQKFFSSYKAYNRDNVIFCSNLRGRGIKKKGLYLMKLGNKPKDKVCLAMIDENSMLWHRRLGHANMRLIQSLASKDLVRYLPKLKFDQHFYDACEIQKLAHASPKAKNIVSTTRCLELLHMDLFGPSAVRSYGGNRYTYVIVDNYSSKACIILNKHTKKIEESLNVAFDKTPPPSKTSPLVDDDLDEEKAIKVAEKKVLENDIEDETLEIDEIICLGVDLEPDEWIKDNGCSKHVAGNQKFFSSYKAYNRDNVIFCSNLRGNIIGKGRGIRKKGLYLMKLGNKPKDKVCLAMIDGNSMLWHMRLGHANMHLIQSLASKELVRYLPKLKFDQHFYNACEIQKLAHDSPKAKNIVSMTRCLELLHMDLFGPSAVRSYGGNRYTYVIVDNYSRKIEESLNVAFDKTPPPSKTSPLVDDDLDKEKAIKVAEKKVLENDIEDETLEIDEIVNNKKSRNHQL